MPELRQTLFFGKAAKPPVVPEMGRSRWDELLGAVEAQVVQARRGLDVSAERLDADGSEELEAVVRVFMRTLERYAGKA